MTVLFDEVAAEVDRARGRHRDRDVVQDVAQPLGAWPSTATLMTARRPQARRTGPVGGQPAEVAELRVVGQLVDDEVADLVAPGASSSRRRLAEEDLAEDPVRQRLAELVRLARRG